VVGFCLAGEIEPGRVQGLAHDLEGGVSSAFSNALMTAFTNLWRMTSDPSSSMNEMPSTWGKTR
jgi:hypothetical protein